MTDVAKKFFSGHSDAFAVMQLELTSVSDGRRDWPS
jgi:hypothetical protein